MRQAHGILAELVLETSAGDGDTVVLTVWPSHEVFDAWIATPERDRLTGSAVHRAVDYRPITRRSSVATSISTPSPKEATPSPPRSQPHEVVPWVRGGVTARAW